MSRKYTTKLLEMIDEGLLNKDTVILAFCKYMPEDDVKDMMEHNEFIEEPEHDSGPNGCHEDCPACESED